MFGLTSKTQTRLAQSRSIDQHRRLVEIDKKYALMSSTTQRQVTSQLEQELDYLLGKKEKQAMKKKKIQELEDIYEKERNNRLSRISFKVSRSDKNRQMSLKEKRLKTKRQLDSVDKVRKRNEHENQQQIQKMLELQKKFDKRPESGSSRSSLNPKSASRLLKHSPQRQDLTDTKSIDSKIERIESKIDNAKTNSHFYFNQISQRAKSYSKNFDDIMGKIKAQELDDQKKIIKDYYKRATHIEQCSENSKTFFQNQSQKKRKEIEDKFKRAKNNLRQIDRRRESKLEDLQIKFNKSFSPKTWKNEKSETYLKHFLENQKQIQNQKTLKAEYIMRKHLDLGLKNRALRQKKDRIIQTVKKVQT